jgi:hypothetical protein
MKSPLSPQEEIKEEINHKSDEEEEEEEKKNSKNG